MYMWIFYVKGIQIWKWYPNTKVHWEVYVCSALKGCISVLNQCGIFQFWKRFEYFFHMFVQFVYPYKTFELFSYYFLLAEWQWVHRLVKVDNTLYAIKRPRCLMTSEVSPYIQHTSTSCLLMLRSQHNTNLPHSHGNWISRDIPNTDSTD